MCCMAVRARTARCRACWKFSAFPTAHSGVMASAVAMHKGYAKAMFRAAGIPVAEDIVASRLEAAERHLMAPPYVIKPMAEGSSVGVFIVTEDQPHPPQELYRDDWAFGEEILIERYIAGKELTCAVIGDRALDVIDIVPATALLRLRGEIRRRRLPPRPARANFTKCLPGGPQTRFGCPQRAWLPRREPRGLSLRRSGRRGSWSVLRSIHSRA